MSHPLEGNIHVRFGDSPKAWRGIQWRPSAKLGQESQCSQVSIAVSGDAHPASSSCVGGWSSSCRVFAYYGRPKMLFDNKKNVLAARDTFMRKHRGNPASRLMYPN
eukprot:scaffold24022_cov168-Amphora_coffeaeformis.AAC.20